MDAIAEASIQVLLSQGEDCLTTMRVAERAGVSVGTLFQYHPNKQTLLFAVLEDHLGNVSMAVESACECAVPGCCHCALSDCRGCRWARVGETDEPAHRFAIEMMSSAMRGATRSALETAASSAMVRKLAVHLVTMCQAYMALLPHPAALAPPKGKPEKQQ